MKVNAGLPGVLAALVFLFAMITGVQEYQSTGSITAVTATLLFAALAVGVMAKRIYDMEKEIAVLKVEADKAKEQQPAGTDDSEEN